MSEFSGVCKPGSDEWESVRIYWGNDKLENFRTTLPFPEIDIPKDASGNAGKDVIHLNKDNIRINPFEPSKTYTSGSQTMDDLFSKSEANFKDAQKKSLATTEEYLFLSPDELKDATQYIHNTTKERVIDLRGSGKKLSKKRKGLIANAVSQFVIVEIEMKSPITCIEDLPSITTWAFLQPPTIGKNKHRISVNNGYVVDDEQKIGWFKAEIKGAEASLVGDSLWSAAIVLDQYKVDDSQNKKDFKIESVLQEALFYVDEKKPNNVKIKFEVVVRNDSTLQDLEEKRTEYVTKEKNKKDAISGECGSYLKIWVRNSNHSWSEDPKDEFSDKIPGALASDDETYDTNNPQKFKNHTWRRSPLLSRKDSKDLLYVGLYPAPVINGIKKLEEQLLKQPSLEENEVNFGSWICISFLFAICGYFLNTAKQKVGERAHEKDKDNEKELDVHIKETGERIFRALTLFNVHEIAAAYAVVGFKQDQTYKQTLELAEKDEAYNNIYSITGFIYEQILSFALDKSDIKKQKHLDDIDEENTKIVDRQEKQKGIKSRAYAETIENMGEFKKPELKEMIQEMKSSFKIDTKSFETAELAIPIISAASSVKMPSPVGAPLPIPFLQWLIWSIEFNLKGAVELGVKASYTDNDAKDGKEEENFAELEVFLKGTGNVSVIASIQSLWTAYIDNTEKGHQTKSNDELSDNFEWGATFKELAKATEINIFLAASVNTSATLGPKFKYDFIKNDFSISLGEGGGGLDCVVPCGTQLSIFQWDYDIASADVAKFSKKEGVFFETLTAFGHTWNKPITLRWAAGLFDLYSTVYGDKTKFVFGDVVDLSLRYSDIEKPSATLSLQLQAGGSDKKSELKGFEKSATRFIELEKGEHPVFTHRAISRFNMQVFNKSDKDKSTFSIHDASGNMDDASAKLMEHLIDEGEYELGASIKFEDEAGKLVESGAGPVLLLPKIKKIIALRDHGNGSKPSFIFKVTIEDYNDDHLWVRFRERDYGPDDVLEYNLVDKNKKGVDVKKYKEWNLMKLARDNQTTWSIYVDSSEFNELTLSRTEKFLGEGLEIYPEFALGADSQYVLEIDSDDIEVARLGATDLEVTSDPA